MDEENSAKIHKLAKSMKDLHLAGSIEEALERAKEIILNTKTTNKDKPIGDMMEEINKDNIEEVKKELEKEEKNIEEIKKDIEDIKQAEIPEIKKTLEETKETIKEVKKEIEKIEENLEIAEEVQEKE